MFRVPLESLNALFTHLAQDMETFAPIRVGNELNYARYSSGANVDLQSLKTANTPKDLILPQSEDIYNASTKAGKIEIKPAQSNNAPFVIFGIKACDIKAIGVLDNIYLKGDFVDVIYQARRESAYLVSLTCNKPAATCFCAAFGLDAANAGGDVATWICDEHLYLQAQNDKGQKLLVKIEHLLEPADEAIVDDKKKEIQEKIKTLPYGGIDLSRFTPENTLKLFNDENWEHLYKACLGCGVCTYICPTCSCYDIRDYEGKCGDIHRFRCWDSCMYPDFTLMAHGNPRISQKERFRQRFMHKLAYHNEKFGEYGCVGCGRCVNKCPVSLNIVKIIKSLGGAQND